MTEWRARNRDTVRFRTRVSTRTDNSQLQQPLLTVCESVSLRESTVKPLPGLVRLIGNRVKGRTVRFENFCTFIPKKTGDNDQGCLGDNYCPPKCTCIGTVVRCTRAKLTEIPKNIPVETSEL